jgi:hypothetical protein
MHGGAQAIVQTATGAKQMFAPIDVTLAIHLASVLPRAGKLGPFAANETESRRLEARHWLRECEFYPPSVRGFGSVFLGMRLKFALVRNSTNDKSSGRGAFRLLNFSLREIEEAQLRQPVFSFFFFVFL